MTATIRHILMIPTNPLNIMLERSALWSCKNKELRRSGFSHGLPAIPMIQLRNYRGRSRAWFCHRIRTVPKREIPPKPTQPRRLV